VKPIEEHLASFLLGLQRGPWSKNYNRQCLALWRERYGEQVAARTERLVAEGWKDKGKGKGKPRQA
jgi:hypothetical protein